MLKEVSKRDAPQTFEAGMTFQEYMADFRVHRDEFIDHYKQLADIVSELQNNPPLSNVRVLAISEDWCPDCVFNVPILARFVEASKLSSLRIVRRPEYGALADSYPGRGDSSRVPTFIFLDQSDVVIGHWSERCASSHRWFKTFTQDHPMPQLDIRNGIPAPPLLSWMKLRIAFERDRFYGGVWRDVLSEIQVILNKNRVHGKDNLKGTTACDHTEARRIFMSERTHRYEVTVRWTGNTGSGTSAHRNYKRDHEIASSAGKPPIVGSSDPAFRGDANRWNPEELLVASLSACHQLWYLHLCAEAGVIVEEYVDHAEGIMEESTDGSGKFRNVILRPNVVIAAGSDAEQARALHEAAHAKCFIANSVNFLVEQECVVTLAASVSPN